MNGLPMYTPSTPCVNAGQLTRGRLVIVGLGGIGGIVARYAVKFVASLGVEPVHVVLVDGDDFEERNRERMDFDYPGNKAEVVAGRLSDDHGRPGLHVRPVDQYVNKENVAEIVQKDDVVLACVDNHATRKVLSDHAAKLTRVTLISGGNDGVEGDQRGTYGNVQIYRRENGRDLSPSLTRFHPEILEPEDHVPGPSCADLAATTAPQILFANLAAASHMLNALYRWLTDGAAGGANRAGGADGVDGAGGVDGVDGVDGADGADGVDGAGGVDGVDGVDGADGANSTPDHAPAGRPLYDEVCFDIHEGMATPHFLKG